MKVKSLLGLCFILCSGVILLTQVYALQTMPAGKTVESIAKSSLTPVAVINKDTFKFGMVMEGTVVNHKFIIKNTGNAPLSIEKVKTTCGCTTANYTKKIPPGAEGIISIKGNTKGYAGRKFKKIITVYSNDPKRRQLKLYLNGEVEAFAVIEPKNIFLKGKAGSRIQSLVTITPLKKYPFNIVASYLDNLDEKIAFTLEKKPDKYLLIVKNLLEKAGGYNGSIHLKTDNPVKPEIVIYVIGLIT